MAAGTFATTPVNPMRGDSRAMVIPADAKKPLSHRAHRAGAGSLADDKAGTGAHVRQTNLGRPPTGDARGGAPAPPQADRAAGVRLRRDLVDGVRHRRDPVGPVGGRWDR